MKYMLFTVAAVAGLAACTVNPASNRPTSWGKAGVSLLDYQTDSILCATLAERAGTDNGANTAGSITGQRGAGTASATPNAGGTFSTMGGGTYSNTAPPELVSRAATQQRSQEMALKQAQIDTLRRCLVDRGYTEFPLTDEERTVLSTLPQGSDARRDYLYKLGTDPKNVGMPKEPAK